MTQRTAGVNRFVVGISPTGPSWRSDQPGSGPGRAPCATTRRGGQVRVL
ncbi:MAG TPA: hypothetical protein VHU91_10035 [Mycobacteriales bacterium]|nr:hypothetical protein [Mycobacteriales bacterium]